VRIPAFRLSAATAPLRNYRTQGGEPLALIACQACTTPWHLRHLNPDIAVGRLRSGMNLRVPVCQKPQRSFFSGCGAHQYLRTKEKKKSKKRRKKRRRR
jgi:hypothetical protein